MKSLVISLLFCGIAFTAKANLVQTPKGLTAPSGTTYCWSFNGTAIDGCNGQSLGLLADGTYSVSFIDGQGKPQKASTTVKWGKGKVVQMFLIGDSTMADYTTEENYMEKKFPIVGWGQVFQQFMVADSLKKLNGVLRADSVLVLDKAKGGRSTRTFFQEGRWREVYSQLRPGDFVLMQFGHNDGAEQKTERYVPIEGYKEFLRLFVSQTIEKGAHPILVTPVARNYPWKDGRLQNVHGDYPDAMKAVADEMNVPLIDLNQLSMDCFTKLGQAYVTETYFMNFGPGIYPGYPDGQKDNTHFKGDGAKAVAQLVFNALQRINVALEKGRR